MIVYILSVLVVLHLFPPPSAAMDKGGCLTCHQYPGLVALEKSGRLKVLHIDEAKYTKSPHGAIDCRTCHSTINTFPHKNSSVVMCSNKCHHADSTMDSYEIASSCTECHSDYNERVGYMDFYLSTFHKKEQSYITSLENESSCSVCHFLYPHSKNTLARALINMHSGFMVCEVCHLRNNAQGRYKVCGTCHEQKNNLVYALQEPENTVFNGDPFGNFYENKKEKKGLKKRVKELIDSISRRVVPFKLPKKPVEKNTWTRYSVSRIAVFSQNKGARRILINTRDREKAQRFKKVEKRLNPVRREMRIKYFHRNVAKMNVSIVCEECHSNEPVVDYEDIGYNKTEALRLMNLNIKGLVTKYDMFFFPKLFKTNE